MGRNGWIQNVLEFQNMREDPEWKPFGVGGTISYACWGVWGGSMVRDREQGGEKHPYFNGKEAGRTPG